jgi:hypothetical protein
MLPNRGEKKKKQNCTIPFGGERERERIGNDNPNKPIIVAAVTDDISESIVSVSLSQTNKVTTTLAA